MASTNDEATNANRSKLPPYAPSSNVRGNQGGVLYEENIGCFEGRGIDCSTPEGLDLVMAGIPIGEPDAVWHAAHCKSGCREALDAFNERQLRGIASQSLATSISSTRTNSADSAIILYWIPGVADHLRPRQRMR